MSLQAEIDAAPEGATVTLPAGTHGAVVLRQSITLVGDPFGTVLDGAKQRPVIQVAGAGITVRLSGLTLRNGGAQAGGGILFEAGALLVVEACLLQDNAAHAYGGGGIYARGHRLQVERSQLVGNIGRQGGGLLVDALCEANLVSTLIARNRAVLGGGLRAVEGSQLSLEGCTVTENAVEEKGGAGSQLHTAGTMTRRPRVTVRNSIVAGPPVALWNAGAYPSEVTVSRTLLPPGEGEAWPGAIAGFPRFRRQGAQPYALEPGSPGVGAGDPAGIPATARDLAGAARLSGTGKLDLGALSNP